MRVEVSIDKTKKLPEGAVEALCAEFGKRLDENYPDVTFSVRRAHSDRLSVMCGTTHDKEIIDVMLQETWESADDWLQPDQ